METSGSEPPVVPAEQPLAAEADQEVRDEPAEAALPMAELVPEAGMAEQEAEPPPPPLIQPQSSAVLSWTEGGTTEGDADKAGDTEEAAGDTPHTPEAPEKES